MKTTTGFTLIELLVTLSVVVILSTLAVTSYSTTLNATRLTTRKSALTRSLMLARTHAAMYGNYVVLCTSSDGMNCENSKEWQDGWLVFEDPDKDKDCLSGDGFYCSEDQGRILYRQPSFTDQIVTIRYNGVHRKRLRFNPLGQSQGYQSSFFLCDRQSPDKSVRLIISATGRLRSEPLSDLSKCDVEDEEEG